MRSGMLEPSGVGIEDAVVHCSGNASAGADKGWKVESHAVMRASRVLAADLQALYAAYNGVGLEYAPAFRMLSHEWAGCPEQVASAQISHRMVGLASPQVHPADLDGALQLTALAPDVEESDGETRLPFAVDEEQLRSASGELWVSVQRQGAEAMAVKLDGVT